MPGKAPSRCAIWHLLCNALFLLWVGLWRFLILPTKAPFLNLPNDSIYLAISSVAFAPRLFNVGWIRRYIFLRGKRRSFVAAAMIYTHDFNTRDGCVFSLPDR